MGRKLIDIDTLEARVNFDRASNVMFLPPEYATINCILPCVLKGIVLTANGSSGTISVPVGAPITFYATKSPGSSCPTIVYDWTINGAYAPWSSTGNQVYVFGTTGSFLVRAIGECVGCDLIKTASLTVSSTGSCEPGAAYQFHRNYFSIRPSFLKTRYDFGGENSASQKRIRFGFVWFSDAPAASRQSFASGAAAWAGTRSNCGDYSIDPPALSFGSLATAEVLHRVSTQSLLDSTGHDICGRFISEDPLSTPEVIEIIENSQCSRAVETVSHEIGHLLGFLNAGNMLGSGDASDIMNKLGSATLQVKGYHARVLVELYVPPSP